MKPEVRCPLCGALYNVEKCNAAVHSSHTARAAERKDIVDALRAEYPDGDSCAVRLVRVLEIVMEPETRR